MVYASPCLARQQISQLVCANFKEINQWSCSRSKEAVFCQRISGTRLEKIGKDRQEKKATIPKRPQVPPFRDRLVCEISLKFWVVPDVLKRRSILQQRCIQMEITTPTCFGSFKLTIASQRSYSSKKRHINLFARWKPIHASSYRSGGLGRSIFINIIFNLRLHARHVTRQRG
jgi:hypothetical protein